MILEELLHLLERPTPSTDPQAGNFYNKFQNIDKIIEREHNDKTVADNFDLEIKKEKLIQ